MVHCYCFYSFSIVTAFYPLLLRFVFLALPPTYETHVGSSEIKELVASEEFIDFQKKTKLLKHVDLRKLDDDEARICFMINLFNVMFIHGVLIVISGSLDGTPSLDVSDYPRWTYECLMESPTGRFAIDQFFSYEVGQLGVIRYLVFFKKMILSFFDNFVGQLILRTKNKDIFLQVCILLMTFTIAVMLNCDLDEL